MHRLISCLLALGTVLAATGPAQALNPASVDILGFRLGMSLRDARAGLAAQGLAGRAHERGAPCPGAAEKRCISAIRIRTADGVLTLQFGPGAAAFIHTIVYALDGRGAGESAMIRSAVTDRFGRPNSLHPMAWCRLPTDAPSCPPDRPRLTFALEPDGTNVLTLSLRQVSDPPDPSVGSAPDAPNDSRR